MKSSDVMTVIVVLALLGGGWWLLASHHGTSSAEAAYYEPKPSYLDKDPGELPDDWSGWGAKVDVFVRHKTNRPACEAVEYGWLTWREGVPVLVHTSDSGKKHVVVRTDHAENPADLLRVPAIELPWDKVVDVDVSTRIQRNQYLVDWAHKYGFRFEESVPNIWHDYYAALKQDPGLIVVIPASGHTMRECRSRQESDECDRSPGSMRCEDGRYSVTHDFLYKEWATDQSSSEVLSLLKRKKPAPRHSDDAPDFSEPQQVQAIE